MFGISKEQDGESATIESFAVSHGFEYFEKHNSLHCMKVKGEAVSADTEAAEKYPAALKIIEEGGNIAK